MEFFGEQISLRNNEDSTQRQGELTECPIVSDRATEVQFPSVSAEVNLKLVDSSEEGTDGPYGVHWINHRAGY